MHAAASDDAGVVVYRNSGDVDAIDEHSRRLVAVLCASGSPAVYLDDGLGAVRGLGHRPPWILLQYMPFSYGHWGIAPALLREAATVRRRTGARFAVLVHEGWAWVRDWRSLLMATYQRAQLRALLRFADVTMATTQALAGELGEHAVHVPVASNVTRTGVARSAARAGLGLGDEFVVVMFGRGHETRALDHGEAAITALADAHGAAGIAVLNLGMDAPPLAAPPGVRVDSPGRLGGDELSLRLAASDLCLMPFADGVSTKRTTLMAAFAHGVPVIGSRGAATDRILREHPRALMLTEVGDRRAFAQVAVALSRDRERLCALGEAGRRLYEEQFDWPIAARRVAAAVALRGA